MVKAITPKKTVKQDLPPKQIIPEKYQDLFYCILLVLAVFIFFAGAIFGGGFHAEDNIASASLRPFVEQSNKLGIYPQWIPYVFAGFPNFASMFVNGVRNWDFIAQFIFGITVFFGQIFGSDVARISMFYMIYAIGMYWLMRVKGLERYAAFIAAFGAVFSTYVITWVMIGHNTKPIVFCMFPYIILLMEKLREKFSVFYAILLIVCVHFMVEGAHVQMIFYVGCAIIIYMLYEFITRLIRKEQPLRMLRSAVVLLIAGGFAFLMSADKFLSTMEYTPFSTRGSAPVIGQKDKQQDESGGNDYNYATAWSYSPGETFTFLVPGYFGNGARKFHDEMQSLYWGSKESEDSPPYMGIAVLALALLGLVLYRRNVFVQFLFILCIFSLFLSFGKNLPILYDIFYYHLPGFNKFRAPSMALALMQFAVPVLAGFGLAGALKWRQNFERSDKKILSFFLIISGLFLLAGLFYSAIFKSSYFDAVYAKFNTTQLPPEVETMLWGTAVSDWLTGGVILLALFTILFLYAKKKLNLPVLYIGIFLLLIIDLWRVDYRRMDISKQKLESEIFTPYQALFKPLQQLKDTSVFRIADFGTQKPNMAAYFLIEDINGYHSAKLRIYQDLLDAANGKGYEYNTHYLNNQFLWNLMNVKYIIAPENTRKGRNNPVIFPNPEALPRAFFVNSAEVVKPLEILEHLKNGDFNPLKVAYYESQLPLKPDTLFPDASVQITSRSNQYMKLEANASGNNILFIGEIYYPPAWKAYIDGVETPIYKTNYAFRSVIVPQGKHTIEMKYHSDKFEQGRTMSLFTNIIVLVLVAVGAFLEIKSRKARKGNLTDV